MPPRKKRSPTTDDVPQPPAAHNRISFAEVQKLRAAPPAPPKNMSPRRYILDSPQGEVKIVITGPLGAITDLQASNTSLVVSTGDAEPVSRSAVRATRAAAPPRPASRPLSGDPTEPGGTIEANLPGDDDIAEAKAREIEADTFDFLRSTERAMLRRNSNT